MQASDSTNSVATTLSVLVADVNDNAPEFSQPFYEVIEFLIIMPVMCYRVCMGSENPGKCWNFKCFFQYFISWRNVGFFTF